MITSPFSLLSISCIILLSISGCIRNPATRKVHARLLSPEAEKSIGLSTKKQIVEEYRLLQSTAVTAYVDSIGQKLAAVCDRPTVDYDFTVLDNDLINAFAVPGGYIFVTRGLLEDIDDEAELAMVLAHEIGHVAALHGVQMIQKEMGQNALSVLGTIGAALTLGPEAMLMVANTANLFSSLYMLGYSRDKELESDALGVRYLMRAGYDPQASLRFLKQLQKQDNEDVKGWDLYFRTHPPIAERIKIIESMIGQNEEDKSRSRQKEYQEMKAQLPKVPDSDRGTIKEQAYRNTSYGLSIHVPSNWELGFYNPQALVSFRTKNMEGEGRLQSVELSSVTTTAEELAFRYSRDSDFQFQNGREVLIQAGYGYLGRYLGVSPGGKLLDIRLFAIIRRGRGYILLCGTDPEKFDSYFLDIEKILRAFKFEEGKS